MTNYAVQCTEASPLAIASVPLVKSMHDSTSKLAQYAVFKAVLCFVVSVAGVMLS